MRTQECEDKIYLYGAGQNGIEWARKLGRERICAFVDRDDSKVGSSIESILVISVDELAQIENPRIFITVSEQYYDEALEFLRAKKHGRFIIGSPYKQEVVKISDKAIISPKTVFEGANYVGKGSRVIDCVLGYASYVAENVNLINTICGKYSSVAAGVSIIRGRHPSDDRHVSTHPAFFSVSNTASQVSFVERDIFEEFSFTPNGYSCEIGNDVWIGQNALIKEGVTIGDGAIVGAGAVVVNNVAPYAVVAGVPAKKVRNRFSQDNIDFLTELKWWDKDSDWIKSKSAFFDDIEELKKHYKEHE